VVRKRVLLADIGEGIVRSKQFREKRVFWCEGELNWESKPRGGHW